MIKAKRALKINAALPAGEQQRFTARTIAEFLQED